jgi:streptogramin lyase
VNAQGDLWMVNRGANQLIRVDAQNLDWEQFAIPSTPYGMGVDGNGDPWVVSYAGGPGADHVYRFDVVTSTFVDAGGTNGYYRGMNLDRDGRAWVGGNSPCRLAVFDAQSDTLISDDIALPGCSTPVGVSIDVDGFVWVVDQNGTAFKVDPTTYAIQLTVSGLVGPYTYSDMTGAGLNLVLNPPG